MSKKNEYANFLLYSVELSNQEKIVKIAPEKKNRNDFRIFYFSQVFYVERIWMVCQLSTGVENSHAKKKFEMCDLAPYVICQLPFEFLFIIIIFYRWTLDVLLCEICFVKCCVRYQCIIQIANFNQYSCSKRVISYGDIMNKSCVSIHCCVFSFFNRNEKYRNDTTHKKKCFVR